MTFDDNNPTPLEPSVPPTPTPPPPPAAEEPVRMVQPIPRQQVTPPVRKKGSAWRVIVGILFAFSLAANMVLILLLAIVGIAAFSGGETNYREEVIRSGPRDKKIAVISLDGIIDDKMSELIRRQVELARRDDTIKAVILQINSPGGGVAASDRIYKELTRLTKDDGKPAVACMQDLAASGGYYSAVGCDSIIAEPTTITGSIGVIMSSFVVQELLENKLGIQPVVITAGGKKDWPSMYKPVTDEQRAYLEERLIRPAYKRFVSVVKQGRPNLTSDQVDELADGSIYSGEMAMQVGLVDKVGYFQDAVDEAMKLANIKNATVVRLKEPLTLSEILTGAESKSAVSMFKIDRSTVYELSTPQLMYLWSY
jgi:protease IV